MTAPETLAPFAAALTRPDHPLPDGLTTWNGSDPGQRFAVYRNNVVVSLIDALAARFPVVLALVGEAFFRDMARVYCADNPPRSVIMARYGADFPDFIATFAPAGGLPYLADVATLEAARTDACHAADAASLGPEAFAAIPGDRLADLIVGIHPSARILRSRFAIVLLWGAHNGHGDIGDVDPFQPEDALVIRPDQDVAVLRLAPGQAAVLGDLERGRTVGAAMEAALAATPEFNPADLFSLLIASGLATSLTLAGDQP